MPVYEYHCQVCGRVFECSQAMSEAPLTTCETCGGDLRKAITGGAGFFLKNTAQAGPRSAGACSLERTGRTCCGSKERCGAPGCGSGK